MKTITLGIHGGAGRLGRRILALALEDARFSLGAVMVREGSAAQGQDVGVLAGAGPVGLLTTAKTDDLLSCDVVIDVSSPAAGAKLATFLASSGQAKLVTGTTGWNPSEDKVLSEAATRLALLRTGNFSLGVTALVRQVRENAARLGQAWGVHIHDIHHSAKKDAPSGTALMLARAVSQGWAEDTDPLCLPVGAALPVPPKAGEIVITAQRQGDIVGIHDVYFYGHGETLQFSHQAQSRDIFARGALHAAHWVSDKPAGLYGMDDVLSPTGAASG